MVEVAPFIPERQREILVRDIRREYGVWAMERARECGFTRIRVKRKFFHKTPEGRIVVRTHVAIYGVPPEDYN